MDKLALVEQLGEFGLSEKEIAAYLTILDHGETTITVVAEEADISRRYTYQIVKSLDDREFVELNDHVTPTTVRANEPEVPIRRLREGLDSIEPLLESRRTDPRDSIEQFEVIKTRETVLKRLRQLIEDTEDGVQLSVAASILPKIEAELRAAVERGVFVQLLVSDVDPDTAPERFAGLGSVVRITRHWSPLLLVADDIDVALLPPRGLIEQPSAEIQAIKTHNDVLVYLLRGANLYEWSKGREASVMDPPPLPQTISAFGFATFVAALYRRAGTDIRVTAQIRPVRHDGAADRPFDSIEGDLVGVQQYFISPSTDTIPPQNTLEVETDDGTVAIGGVGAFLEDYEAREVTLRAAGGGRE